LWLTRNAVAYRLSSNLSDPDGTFESMPRISSFYGITILMFFGDHNPPHFHARYGEHSARIGLDGTFLDGELPRRATRMVLEWTSLHRNELAECWEPSTTSLPVPLNPCVRSRSWWM
jgi:hypothetical protein